MIDLGNGKYQITNKKTGENRVVTADELPKYGLSAPTQPDQQQGNPVMGALKGVGDFFTGGAVSAIGNRVNAYKDIGQYGPEILKNIGSNPKQAFSTFQEKLQPHVSKLTNPGEGMTIAAGLGATANLPKLLTSKGVAGLTKDAANSATEKGAQSSFPDLSKKITDAVTKKFGSPEEVMAPLKKLITEKTPTTLGDNPMLTASELLDWRKQISTRIGSKNFLQRMFTGTNIDEKVANEARRIISQEFKELAPSARILDSIASKYAKFGDIPTNIQRALAYYVLNKTPLGKYLPF